MAEVIYTTECQCRRRWHTYWCTEAQGPRCGVCGGIVLPAASGR